MRLIKKDVSKGRLCTEQSRGNAAMTTSGLVVSILDSYRLSTHRQTGHELEIDSRNLQAERA